MGPFQCLLLFSFYIAAAAASEDWCYPSQKCKNQGCKEPLDWVDSFPACGGKEQSPINIVTNKVTVDGNLKPFDFTYLGRPPGNWSITNTGHSVQVDLDGSATIASGGLQSQYKAVQFHFHWGRGTASGQKREPGSEHTIDGERYAMELHLVHIKDGFPNITEALPKKGVAVLGFFVEIGEENKNYAPLISMLNKVTSPGDVVPMESLSLSSLIPPTESLTKYYRYTGSLTTPACSEGVIWTLFEEPINMSLAQVKEFWTKLFFDTTKTVPMEDNFRPVQPLGDRTVYRSDSNALGPPAKTLLLLPAVTYLLFSFTQ